MILSVVDDHVTPSLQKNDVGGPCWEPVSRLIQIRFTFLSSSNRRNVQRLENKKMSSNSFTPTHTHTPRKTIITIWLPLKSDDAFLEQKSPFCLQGLHFLGEICHANVLVFRNAAVKLTVEVREVGVDF